MDYRGKDIRIKEVSEGIKGCKQNNVGPMRRLFPHRSKHGPGEPRG
jgi:hypothetical protein